MNTRGQQIVDYPLVDKPLKTNGTAHAFEPVKVVASARRRFRYSKCVDKL